MTPTTDPFTEATQKTISVRCSQNKYTHSLDLNHVFTKYEGESKITENDSLANAECNQSIAQVIDIYLKG